MRNIFKKIKYQSIFLWLIFFLISLLVFKSVLNNFFASDDFHWLLIAKERAYSWEMLITNYSGENLGGAYSPLFLVIFKIFFKLFGLKYAYYHLVSILLHSINGYLVYCLSKKIFRIINLSKIKAWSFVAGILFLLWPTHVETVSWIAAWPHLWTAFFYLLSLISYFKFRDSNKYRFILLSFLFFILALFNKEIAISLPFVILLWEIYFYSLHKKVQNIKEYFILPTFFSLLIVFLGLRYLATNLLIGYYGRFTFDLTITKWIGNLASLVNELLTVSFLRVFFFKVWYHYLDNLVIIFTVFLALYFYWLLIKKKIWEFTVIISCFLVMAPFLLVMLHRTTFAGERYLYLPSIFFIPWLVYLLSKISWNRIKMFLLIVLVLACLGVINYKNNIWNISSQLTKHIVDSYSSLELAPGQELISVGLPDNLVGAEVFRNNLQQALQFYYPSTYPNIYSLPVYVQIDLSNMNNHLLDWRSDDLGWFAESVDGSFVVTGVTSIEVNNVYFELWNYNYQNYLANTIRFMPTEELKARILSGEVGILTFDQGKLKIIE